MYSLGNPQRYGRTRSIFAGQNSDMTSDVPPLAYVLHLQPRE